MRMTELLLSIPSLYLIIALRAVFPIDLPSQQVYLGIVAILAFIGWAGLARVIRGLVLSIRKSEFVTAAEALGVGRAAHHRAPHPAEHDVVRDRGGDDRRFPATSSARWCCRSSASACRSRARRGATC